MIKRDKYLKELINSIEINQIKIITGMRRCGKTFLLFDIFQKYLLENGVDKSHILSIHLDDFAFAELLDKNHLYKYVKERIKDDKEYFLLLDEIQSVQGFESVLNGFAHIENLNIYVTGSNAKFLSTDIVTEFRGRGFPIHLSPLYFKEFEKACEGLPFDETYRLYSTYGGLPLIAEMKDEEAKAVALRNILLETYLTDIKERHHIRNDSDLNDLMNYLASSIGGLTNPTRLSNTFITLKKKNLSANEITNYLSFLEDSFLIEKSVRYDVKGRAYINTPFKYYYTDIGIRNAQLNFGQMEDQPRIFENIVYNELKVMGYKVDIGLVNTVIKEQGKSLNKSYEIDFVCSKKDKRIYVQCAYDIPNQEKYDQEAASFRYIKDGFPKIIVTRNNSLTSHYTQEGILIINMKDFVTKPIALL